MLSYRLVLVLILLGVHTALSGQTGFVVEPDTVEEVTAEVVTDGEKARLFAGRPGKAALYSLVLPGAGQIYNKRWWKAPIVWGGVGVAGYAIHFNTSEYKRYKTAYRERLITDMEGLPPMDEFAGRFSTDQIRSFRDRFNRFRQTSIIVTGLVWVLQSAEAFVDAHLKEFDISDDLSFRFRPVFIDQYSGSAGIGLVLQF